jgi:hypothetical protein
VRCARLKRSRAPRATADACSGVPITPIAILPPHKRGAVIKSSLATGTSIGRKSASRQACCFTRANRERAGTTEAASLTAFSFPRTVREVAKQRAHVRGGRRAKRMRCTDKPGARPLSGTAGTRQQGDDRLAHETGAVEIEAHPPGHAGRLQQPQAGQSGAHHPSGLSYGCNVFDVDSQRIACALTY